MRKGYWMVLCVFTLGLTVLANEKAPASFSDAMKSNGATLQKLGKDADAKDYDAIAADAATLKKNFMGPVGSFFTDKKMEAALNKCKDAFAASDQLEKAAKAKNEMGVADARKAVQGACGACHTAHREKLADGSFEVK